MLKNAFAYVTRKGLKSLVILLVILTMSALSLISLSIKEATDKASTKTFSNITNSFSMERTSKKPAIQIIAKTTSR